MKKIFPSNQARTKSLLSILSAAVITLLVVVFVPLLAVLALNQVLPDLHKIEYSLNTFVSSIWLGLIVAGIRIINSTSISTKSTTKE